MKGTASRTSLYTFGVLYFDEADRCVGAIPFFTRARSQHEARQGLHGDALFAVANIADAVRAQVYSARDVCCAEFRRPVTIEPRRWKVTEKVVFQ